MSLVRSILALSLAGAAAAGGASLVACETETPTTSFIDNGAPSVVYRGWWLTTYYDDPVAPGATSAERRSVPGVQTAYAVLAPGWDPTSTTPPTALVAVQSKVPVSADRGEALHIRVDDTTFRGSCASGQPLTQDEADFITQRIFPGEFAGMVYDAKTCTLHAAPPDAGVTDGGGLLEAGS